jgi:cytochrome b6-f complex subunit 4
MTEEKSHLDERTVPFWPDHLLYEAKVALWFGIGLLIIGIIGLFIPVGLGDPADPMVTPEHTKPEWYFLALFQLLKYLPKTFGAVLPILLILGIALLPFFNNQPDTSRITSRNRLIITIVAVVVIVFLTIIGEVT